MLYRRRHVTQAVNGPWTRQAHPLHVLTPTWQPPRGPPRGSCTRPRVPWPTRTGTAPAPPAWRKRTASANAGWPPDLSTNKRPAARHVAPSMRSYPHDASDERCPILPSSALKPLFLRSALPPPCSSSSRSASAALLLSPLPPLSSQARRSLRWVLSRRRRSCRSCFGGSALGSFWPASLLGVV